MATISSCKTIAPPQNIATSVQSGEYAVNYSVNINVETSDNLYAGPINVLKLAQGPLTKGNHPVPKRWRTYNYVGILSTSPALGLKEEDKSSYCRDWIITPTNSLRTNWTITSLFSRLNPGEMPNLDVNGNEITNPLQWWPRYSIRKFVVGEILDGGWPRDAIANGDSAGNLESTPIYGPFKLSGKIVDRDRHPLDDTSQRTFTGIDYAGSPKAAPVTKANLLSPTNFPRINQEYAVLVVRMNWPSIESFWLQDQAQRNTVWNGGDDWRGNVEGDDLVLDNQEGRQFFSCPWGMARYQGGGIVSDPLIDNGIGYYVGEFRYELFFDRESLLRVRNEDVMDITGQQIITSGEATANPTFATSPQWLDLEGKWLGAQSEDANWVRWWYGGGVDYSKISNGQVTPTAGGGTQPIQVGMFQVGDDYTFPPSFPYPVDPQPHQPISV